MLFLLEFFDVHKTFIINWKVFSDRCVRRLCCDAIKIVAYLFIIRFMRGEYHFYGQQSPFWSININCCRTNGVPRWPFTEISAGFHVSYFAIPYSANQFTNSIVFSLWIPFTRTSLEGTFPVLFAAIGSAHIPECRAVRLHIDQLQSRESRNSSHADRIWEWSADASQNLRRK